MRDQGWLLDMLLAARRVSQYVKDVTEEEFQQNRILQDAVVKRLEVIGEAANQVTGEFKSQNPEVPWSLIIGMRHWLIHGYFNIDLAKVWDAAQNDVPNLIQQIEPLLPPDEG